MYHAAWIGDTGGENVKEMSGLKAFGCEVVNQVMYDCVQFHGGMGYMRESAIERMYRDARILPIGGGATEVMLEEVAKRSVGGRARVGRGHPQIPAFAGHRPLRASISYRRQRRRPVDAAANAALDSRAKGITMAIPAPELGGTTGAISQRWGLEIGEA